mgnify:CR=1 FL=1
MRRVVYAYDAAVAGYNAVVAAAYQYFFLSIYKTVAKAVIFGIALFDTAFRYCTSLESLTIPRAVTTINSEAFYECNALTEINFNADNCGDLWVADLSTLIERNAQKPFLPSFHK